MRSLAIVTRSVAVELAYSPLWWYTTGLKRQGRTLLRQVRYANDVSGVSPWLTNLFVPMFGQHDIAGRVISFFMRLAQLLVRFLVYVGYVLVAVLLLVLYVVIPPIILWKLIAAALHLLR